jgi:Na+-transporting NADH:ubiquinone oxidoreductase subunit NqrB
MKTWVILAIVIFAIILLVTVFNVIFQSGAGNDNTTAFPNPIYKSLNIDIFGKYGLIVFSAIALCFCIMGLPRKK